ncbi:MAG TPA: methionine--tRNA ligase [Candidatus Paceibacterota bacterium]|nr:methionine--tRNA ligase [Candidatus Paceibacterota bacterium]
MAESRYITTTLPYVNADPHIGFAFEIVTADALARYWRLMGDRVFFNTGSDEHGQKIFEKAKEAGQDPQAYVDHYAGEFVKLKESLSLSYDRFIRTTDPAHIAAAQEIWRRCAAAGDIYKKEFSGLYCVGDEMFLRESDLVDGKCPNHPNMTPIELTEENYFFRLSKYQDYLLAYLADESAVVPEWRRQEAINFVKGGLEDFSISREKARLSWGIPVPDDDTQVMYVWFDALTNYISTLGWPADAEGAFAAFWQDGVPLQLAGKDQVRFQSVMWQAMLRSAGVAPTKQVVYHGFITSGGQKMSKSLGNVISPSDLVARYGTEATRYLLLRHVMPFEDTDITWERLDEWYTAGLVNGLGNLVARVMNLSQLHIEEPIPDLGSLAELDPEFCALIDGYRLSDALDLLWQVVAKADEHMTATQPFRLVKSVDEAEVLQGKQAIAMGVVMLAKVAAHLAPFMPATSAAIWAAIRDNTKPENLFPRL